jgi:hypothetical protein
MSCSSTVAGGAAAKVDSVDTELLRIGDLMSNRLLKATNGFV